MACGVMRACDPRNCMPIEGCIASPGGHCAVQSQATANA